MSQFLDKAKNFVAEKVVNIKKPEASFEDVDLKNVSRECVEYTSKVNVDNPYDHSIPICEISYTFKSAGRVIASGTMPDPGSLKASDKTLLEVPMKVPYGIMVSLAKDIGADWDIDYEAELGLTIDLPIIGNFTIPISRKGQIKLPTLSDIF
ncbi:hypothetical protein Patl1_04220 [Pistacia atlantica]|uniref:Uncharacterized protein n=1 Tax=Pistacia atlantica TaxID=434234 RepID=A0ACC1BRP2_9ROSI|nr:hypothetical protein Patl1_04220 [Pistacia atlantica]